MSTDAHSSDATLIAEITRLRATNADLLDACRFLRDSSQRYNDYDGELCEVECSPTAWQNFVDAIERAETK